MAEARDECVPLVTKTGECLGIDTPTDALGEQNADRGELVSDHVGPGLDDRLVVPHEAGWLFAEDALVEHVSQAAHRVGLHGFLFARAVPDAIAAVSQAVHPVGLGHGCVHRSVHGGRRDDHAIGADVQRHQPEALHQDRVGVCRLGDVGVGDGQNSADVAPRAVVADALSDELIEAERRVGLHPLPRLAGSVDGFVEIVGCQMCNTGGFHLHHLLWLCPAEVQNVSILQ